MFPPNIIGVGLNYARHAEETGVNRPGIPVMFLKGTNSITAHEEPIILPKIALREVDFEGELAIVIGKPARNVAEAEALCRRVVELEKGIGK